MKVTFKNKKNKWSFFKKQTQLNGQTHNLGNVKKKSFFQVKDKFNNRNMGLH